MWKKSGVSTEGFVHAIHFLTLLLLCSASPADIHKWVDAAGQVHYGDCPPNDCVSQSVEIPNPPSQQEVERAHQRLERYQQIIRKMRTSRDTGPLESPAPMPLVPDKTACFDPINDIVIGPSSELYEPIVPSHLSKLQQRYLNKLFDKLDTHWREGKVNTLTCAETSAQRVTESRYADDAASLEVDVTSSENRLRIKLEWYDEKKNQRDRRILNFAVGDKLYFTRDHHFQNLDLPGNSVEILHLDSRSLLFLIKPRIRAVKGRIPIPEIRYLVVSVKQWSLTELRYPQNRLFERRDWVFAKSRH